MPSKIGLNPWALALLLAPGCIPIFSGSAFYEYDIGKNLTNYCSLA
jgi:hypothetical protein